MDKKALQTYSVWAKENLEQQVEVALKTLGINSDDDIKGAKLIGDFTVIEGDENSYPSDYYEKRNKIVSMVKNDSYKNVIEEVAYTWFNRFVALRFMELHDFLPHGFRVLSDKNGGIEPEIIKNMSLAKYDLNLDMDYCNQLRSAGNTEELYRHIIMQQCKMLADILPMLFEKNDDAIELLLPKTLLRGETVVSKLIDIPESCFMEDVEAIGWLYQFYVADDRKEFRDAKKVTKELIPTLTQIFTTDWIVKYMTENSLGRVWLESYPNSSLKTSMKYYIEDAEQPADVKEKLEEIRYKNVNPEDIKIIEPCCGSGHILAYAFDLLYLMYEEKGYQKSDIPTLILSNNLFGLEIDKRAAQLAGFSLLMKARMANPRFFNDKFYAEPQVYEIYDSKYLLGLDYKNNLKSAGILDENELHQIIRLVEDFRYAKTIGSLLKLKPYDFSALESAIEKIKNYDAYNIFNVELFTKGTDLFEKLIAQSRLLTAKYDVMVTNPPYLGISKLDAPTKEYLTREYPDSKTDMFAMFMEAPFVKKDGFRAIVNPDSWMFLSSYEKLRRSILDNKSITNLLHLGMGAFDATVQTVSFILRNTSIMPNGNYIRLVESKNKELDYFNFNPILSNKNKFFSIPGNPIAYKASDSVISSFLNGKQLSTVAFTRQGMASSDDAKFVRLWHEVSISNIGFGLDTSDNAKHSGKKWFPYNKGGSFRKWFGNNTHVVNYENDGYEVKKYAASLYKSSSRTIKSTDVYFREGGTWSAITSGGLSIRWFGKGYVISNAGMALYTDSNKLLYYIGLLNSKPTVSVLIKTLNESLNFNAGDISRIPVLIDNENDVNLNVSSNVKVSKDDWDSFETSWDFERHPLVELSKSLWDATAVGASMQAYYGNEAPLAKSPLELCYLLWQGECQKRFDDLKANEEELNRIFIDIYGLQDELTPEVEDKDVTVRKADLTRDIKSLISYLIGVEMGRYSLDVTGLAYAGGEWDSSKYVTYQPDEDGIVPVYSKLGMEDSLTQRVIDLIKLIYGEDSYKANIDFIAEALGKKNNESSEETLNRYICDDFFNDHVKIYQKRPIYWMFSSGKYSGFKCLIYMHRYNENTLARINSKYFLAESTRLKKELEEISKKVEVAEGRERIALEKERTRIAGADSEAYEYGQILDHMANKFINIDLDDGVKVNYEKFQKVELVTDGGTKIKKDLLAPIK